MSIVYLDREAQILDAEGASHAWKVVAEADIIEAVMKMIHSGTNYRCGFTGNWGYGEEDEDNRIDSSFDRKDSVHFRVRGKFAHETEHAVVHLEDQYFAQMDRMLRR
jgi:hypothetical protein